ncbi:uncharacterized protein LOC119560714 [Drosophila subpulchrella]|uniref:uncharacterized protein LOC119560714 n=1 Tax=Drosophila subpulchrella TaxID=1486046 RepID=UPI0018A152CB|nr:uncharacterized protein LOC119560714 [Drosophila subpulchrella]
MSHRFLLLKTSKSFLYLYRSDRQQSGNFYTTFILLCAFAMEIKLEMEYYYGNGRLRRANDENRNNLENAPESASRPDAVARDGGHQGPSSSSHRRSRTHQRIPSSRSHRSRSSRAGAAPPPPGEVHQEPSTEQSPSANRTAVDFKSLYLPD